jgi:DNA-directed RNA polymerase alpha subunit
MKTHSLAIHNVIIYENTSLLVDEILAERLANIPLYSEFVDDYETPSQCQCSGRGCHRCAIDFTLDVTFDAQGEIRHLIHNNDPYPIGVVRSKSLITHDPRVHVLDGDITVTLMPAYGRVLLKAAAIKGSGEQSGKFRPAILVSTRKMPQTNPERDDGMYRFDFETIGTRTPEKIIEEALRNAKDVKDPPPLRDWGK